MDDRGPYIHDFAKRTGWWERDPGEMTNLGIDAVAASARRLRETLESHGVRPDASSSLGAMLKTALVDLPEAVRSHACPPGPCGHLAERVRQLQCAADLVLIERAIHRAGAALGAGVMAARIRDLASGSHAATSPTRRSNQGDRVFELICAGAVSRIAQSVALDEPDVLCTFENERWGIACKVTSGTPEAAGKLIRVGAKQIDRSAADAGVVLVRITDVFPHEALQVLPEADGRVNCFGDPAQLPELAYRLILPFGQAAADAAEEGGIEALGRRFSKFKAVVFTGNTVANILRNGSPVPLLFPVFASWTATPYVPPFCDRLRPALNW